MITQQETPIFTFRYKPRSEKLFLRRNDQGFDVTLYDDNRLVIRSYVGSTVDYQASYPMPSKMKEEYLQLLETQKRLLTALEVKLNTNDVPHDYACAFGFTDGLFFTCHSPEQMLRLPLRHPVGYQARIVLTLFEMITVLLNDYGVYLDWRTIHVDYNLATDARPTAPQPPMDANTAPIQPNYNTAPVEPTYSTAPMQPGCNTAPLPFQAADGMAYEVVQPVSATASHATVPYQGYTAYIQDTRSQPPLPNQIHWTGANDAISK